MPLAAHTTLGPYEVATFLGAGGMGEVYRARDTRLDRSVAIKVLPSHLSSDESLRLRFEHEARAISQLSHPHICTLHDVRREDGVDFLVMEYHMNPDFGRIGLLQWTAFDRIVEIGYGHAKETLAAVPEEQLQRYRD